MTTEGTFAARTPDDIEALAAYARTLCDRHSALSAMLWRQEMGKQEPGDTPTTPADVEAAEGAWRTAVEDWYTADQALKSRERESRHAEALQAAIDAPFEESIALAVGLLRAVGPMTGTEIEARRIRGLSHNLVRPVLREAVKRGLVRRDQVSYRVLWTALPEG